MARWFAQEIRVGDGAIGIAVGHKVRVRLLALCSFLHIREKVNFNFVFATLQRFSHIRLITHETIIGFQNRLIVDLHFGHSVEIINIEIPLPVAVPLKLPRRNPILLGHPAHVIFIATNIGIKNDASSNQR